MGQDVIVTFDGVEHQGHIEKIETGWIHCRIAIKAAEDYGSISARLSPHSTVCVRESDVRCISLP
jgi:hypothetical protein